MGAPGADRRMRALEAGEPLEARTLVSERVVETLVGSILPRLARIDERGIDDGLCEPPDDRTRNELL